MISKNANQLVSLSIQYLFVHSFKSIQYPNVKRIFQNQIKIKCLVGNKHFVLDYHRL